MGKKLKYTEGEGINFRDLELDNPKLSELSPEEQVDLWRELGAQATEERGKNMNDKKE